MAEINPVMPWLILASMAALLLAVLLMLPFVKHRWGQKAVLPICAATICIFAFWWRGFVVWQAQQGALHNAMSIGLACRLYASEHGHKYPSKLEDLVPAYMPGFSGFEAPNPQGGVHGYDYFGGTDEDPPGKILLQTHSAFNGKRAVVYTDLSGRLADAADQ